GRRPLARLARFATTPATTATPAPPLAASAARLLAAHRLVGCGLGGPLACRFLALLFLFLLPPLLLLLLLLAGGPRGGLDRDRAGLLDAVDLLALLDQIGQLAGNAGVGGDHDGHLEALLERPQVRPLLIEQIKRDLRARAHDDVVGRALEQRLLERAEKLQRNRGDRAHVAGAAAMRALVGRALKHARADALTRHFEQPEVGDMANLDARTIVAQRFLEAALDRAVIALLVHIDEVDDDQAGKVTQPQLPRDLVGGLEVGLERGVLDMVLARGAARVDVDRH